MKVSLRWIFDHIVGSVDEIHLPDLISRFNESVAEIEGYCTWQCDPQAFTLVSIIAVQANGIQAITPDGTSVTLPFRDDLMVDDTALIITGTKGWARMSDLGSAKESLLPAIDPKTVNWHTIPCTDTILEIDNKSITHRPDLWSHRGLAREIAALFGLSLTNADTLFADALVETAIPGKTITHKNAPTLTIEAPQACRRLAAGFVEAPWRPSTLPMVLRLCSVDSRPIDGLVDLTNYVMLDYGQPMHAFDAAAIHNNSIIARAARVGEKLAVLDGSELELHSHDLVLADDQKPLSLAGVMGGLKTGVSRTTKKLCIEAGSFEPATIRHTVTRYNKRTEAAIRFEKNLDPEMPVRALQRYLKLMRQVLGLGDAQSCLVTCGGQTKSVMVGITHAFIEEKLGITLTKERILSILQALEFQVFGAMVDGGQGYQITVPSFRATKDIAIPEDIVEEIGRFVGYKNIQVCMPAIRRQPSVASKTYKIRELKRFCATVLRMHEISSYAFYDESWLTHLRWQPAETLEALNPVSGNWRRLVTSLIPALLKAVHENAEGVADVRYFEVGRRWVQLSPVVEQKHLSGIIYTRNSAIDFYTIKEYVTELCAQVGISVTWRKPNEGSVAPWYDPYRVAQCVYNNAVIGTVGLLAESWKERIVQTGFVGIFELDVHMLTDLAIPVKPYTALPKYPDIVRDVSVLISTAITAASIAATIKSVDSRIRAVEVVDFFKRPEWQDRISISFRYVIQESTRTLTTQEADQISELIEQKLAQLGGEIR